VIEVYLCSVLYHVIKARLDTWRVLQGVLHGYGIGVEDAMDRLTGNLHCR
jgi:hypothetical protein